LEACGLLVRETQAMVYALALAILRDPGRAEDATQETFLRAFRRLGDLQEAAAFMTWLRRNAMLLTIGGISDTIRV
jgi:RNA polymerase sigma-70 factor (ECF subfamily)